MPKKVVYGVAGARLTPEAVPWPCWEHGEAVGSGYGTAQLTQTPMKEFPAWNHYLTSFDPGHVTLCQETFGGEIFVIKATTAS